MAVNFADAWKSHILQDFQLPQEYPQAAMEAGTPRLAHPAALLILQEGSYFASNSLVTLAMRGGAVRSRAGRAGLALAGKTERRAAQMRHSQRCPGCGTAA